MVKRFTQLIPYCHTTVAFLVHARFMEETLDLLLKERAPWLNSRRMGVSILRAALNHMLSYRQTVEVGKSIEHLPSAQIMQSVGDRLARDLSVSGLSNLPRSGPALVVANHPTGIADGIVLHKLISTRRSDVFFFANHDILRILPQMSDMIAPVEWRKEKRSHGTARETMMHTRRSLEAGKLGVIFPSGRLAKRRGLSLHERPWMASAATIARKFDVPIIPIRLSARNSFLFYAFDALHPTLRDITLFHETLNKSRQHFDVTVGAPIQPADLPTSSEQAIAFLKEQTLGLSGKPSNVPLVQDFAAENSFTKHRLIRRQSSRI